MDEDNFLFFNLSTMTKGVNMDLAALLLLDCVYFVNKKTTKWHDLLALKHDK